MNSTSCPFHVPFSWPHALRLLALAWLSLFLQLVLLRYLSANVWNFGYFPNLVLLAALLGSGMAFVTQHFISLSFSRRLSFLAPILFMGLLLWVSTYHPGIPGFAPTYAEIYGEFFATNLSPYQRSHPHDLQFLILCFLWLTAIFFTLTQLMARWFHDFRPITAYSLEMGGACLGILCFIGVSYLRWPPSVWFLLVLPVFSWTLYHALEPWQRVVAFFCVLCCAGIASTQDRQIQAMPYQIPRHQTVWSPYQKIDFALLEHGTQQHMLLFFNGLYQQYIALPHDIPANFGSPYLQRQHKTPPLYRRVLILGSGIGNDVAAAIHYGADRIDAVEIDPGIIVLSNKNHPARPYLDMRVKLSNMDGRQFLAQTPHKYDLILFAHVHSFLAASSHARLRQENYLLTLEALRRAYHLLQPDGDLVLYGLYPLPWLQQRFQQLLRIVSGQQPRLLHPHHEYTAFLVNKPPLSTRHPLHRQPLAPSHPTFGLPSPSTQPARTGMQPPGASAQVPPPQPPGASVRVPSLQSSPASMTPLHAASLPSSSVLPTDDWPFVYLRDRSIPWPYLLGMFVLGGWVGLLLLFLLFFPPPHRPHTTALGGKCVFFCLGCAFLLLETKGIVQFSLWFGTTWLNHSLVLLAVLLLVLLANRLALVLPTRIIPLVLLLMVATSTAILWIPGSLVLGIADPLLRWLAAGSLMLTPLFFASLLFALLFRDTAIAPHLVGWNLLGSVFGAALESVSLLWGYHALSWIVLGLYLAVCLFLLLSRLSKPHTIRS